MKFIEEITFQCPNVAVVRAWVECWEVSDSVRGHGERGFVRWRGDGRGDGRRDGCNGRRDGGRDSGGDGGHVVDECRGFLTAKESSSSIEQKQKRLEINGELDDL